MTRRGHNSCSASSEVARAARDGNDSFSSFLFARSTSVERSASWPGLAPVPVSSTRPGHSCDQNVFLNLMNWSLEDLNRTEAADRRRDGHCVSRDLVTGDGGPGLSPSGQSVPNSSQ